MFFQVVLNKGIDFFFVFSVYKIYLLLISFSEALLKIVYKEFYTGFNRFAGRIIFKVANTKIKRPKLVIKTIINLLRKGIGLTKIVK